MVVEAAAAALLALNTCREIDLAFDTDVEFVVRRCHADPAEVERYVQALVAEASAVTAATLDLRLRVAEVRVRTGPAKADPWDAPIAEDQLAQFQAVWNRDEGTVRRQAAILLSGRDLGESPAFEAGLCSPEGYAVLSGLTGVVPVAPHSFEEGNDDLIALLRAVGTLCGAPRTDECDPAACPGGGFHGPLMSRCDECPGGAANVELAFAPASIEAIWTTLDRKVADGCPIDSASAGVRAANDQVTGLAGTMLVADVLANDERTNCGPITLVGVDPRLDRGWPLSTIELSEGRRGIVVTLPPEAAGAARASYRISDSEEAIATGRLDVRVRSADVNADGRVDRLDLVQVLERIGRAGGSADMVDFDGDGRATAHDLGLFLSVWTGPREEMPPPGRP